MKSLSTILFLFFHVVTYGQSTKFERDSLGRLIFKNTNFQITESNHAKFYERAKCMIEINEQDSLIDAYKIFKSLYYYDSAVYSINSLQNMVTKIQNVRYSYLLNSLIGEWNFEWSGTNWGTTQTSIQNNEKVVFTDDEVFFYNGDSLKRRTRYIITNKFAGSLFQELYFQLYFLDSDDIWDFSFWSSGSDFIAKLKFDSQRIGLRLSEMPNCSCGCPERIYIKNIPTKFTIYE